MKSSSQAERKLTLLGICCWTIIKLIVWIVAAWLVALIIGFYLFIFLDKQVSIIYLQHLTTQQLQYLKHLSPLLWLQNPAAFVAKILQCFNDNLVVKVQILVQAGHDNLQDIKSRNDNLNTFIQVGERYIVDSINLIILVTRLIILRFITLILFLPVFAMAGFLALIDGLIQRELRRFNGGRESALLYHRARSVLIPLLFWGSFLYAVLPFNLTPDHFLLPFAVMFALAVWLTAKMFKKYL